MEPEVERTAVADFFPGFARLDLETDDVSFQGVIGGAGPPVLLLHGYPQTHVALMDRLGHEQFAVVGHDRGARAGYRLALDHPQRVTAYASLTVVPTLDAFACVDKTFALNAWHWFFLAQPADLPERMLASDPDAYIDAALAKMAGEIERIDPLALEAYRTAFRNPDVRHAICEDYRAATSEDLEQDASDFAAGRKLGCPMLVLWSETEHKARNHRRRPKQPLVLTLPQRRLFEGDPQSNSGAAARPATLAALKVIAIHNKCVLFGDLPRCAHTPVLRVRLVLRRIQGRMARSSTKTQAEPSDLRR